MDFTSIERRMYRHGKSLADGDRWRVTEVLMDGRPSKTLFTAAVCSILLASFIMVLAGGCAYSRFGRADVTPFHIRIPAGLVGLTKSQVIDRFGLPEGAVADENGVEYWEYNNLSNYYFLVFGKGVQKNLILQIEKNVVKSVRLVSKGGSVSFATGGM